MFLNLTHHPSEQWGTKQIAAANAISPGVVDVSFPDVDPSLDEASVCAIGLDLLTQIGALAPQAALVQGEPVLAYFLINELERQGIPCYAASTLRKVSESRVADGSVRKLSAFDFVRFRRYRISN